MRWAGIPLFIWGVSLCEALFAVQIPGFHCNHSRGDLGTGKPTLPKTASESSEPPQHIAESERAPRQRRAKKCALLEVGGKGCAARAHFRSSGISQATIWRVKLEDVILMTLRCILVVQSKPISESWQSLSAMWQGTFSCPEPMC